MTCDRNFCAGAAGRARGASQEALTERGKGAQDCLPATGVAAWGLTLRRVGRVFLPCQRQHP
eukprot:358912-Chlamydomonas_euryale.AAC.1